MWNMKISGYTPLILLLITILLGCESKKTYDIDGDLAIKDLNERISTLQNDLNTLTTDLAKVRESMKDMDVAVEFRTSLRKELHEGEKHMEDISQWIDLLKIQRKQRHKSLIERKNQPDLIEVAQKEVEAYFIQTKLKPIKRPWENRYRTAASN